MLSKLRTLTIGCTVAVLAISAVSLACDKDKQVAAKSQCGSQKTAVVQVADGTSQCSKSRQATSVAIADTTAGCAKSAATKETMALLAKAIHAMPNDAARADVIAAYRTLAVANPNLTCEKQASTVKAVAVASGCCASKAKQAKNTQVANVTTTACDPANCAAKIASGECSPADCKAAKAAKATQVSGQSACSKSRQARFVAFGCEKTDTLARAAANNYLSIMSALKAYSGADGCSASCASKLLAQVLADESAQAQAVEVETVANIETPVSLGAVSETKTQCSGKK